MKIEIISKPTFRDVRGRFAAANDQLLAIRRDALRSEGGYLVGLVRQELDVKTDGRSGKLGAAVRFNTREYGKDELRLNVTAPSKARPHRIYPRNAGALAFFWGKIGAFVVVPKGGGRPTRFDKAGTLWVGKGYVDHPGGSLRPLFTPVMARALERWTAERGAVVLRQISTRYKSAVKG